MTSVIPSTPETVMAALVEAADTLRRLPKSSLQNRLTSWPEVVRSSAELFSGEKHARNRLSPPTPDAIDRMDAVLVWLLPLAIDQRRMLWARACGVPWRRLEDMDGRSHVTLRKIYNAGLAAILQRLPAQRQSC
jgi:Domain of unknown function (DUF6362)